MKILIVHNESSGYRGGAVYDFIRSLSLPGNEVTLRTFNRDNPWPEKLSDADNYDVVVASGGDGTVARVSYELRDTQIPIMPFPSGTSNALATNLFSASEPHALATQLLQMNTMDFDMGEISFAGETHGFSLVAGCGYDATIMDAAEQNKQLLGPVAYFQAAFLNPNPQKSHLTIEIDGEVHETEGLSVMVANFSKMQYDIALTHQNLPRDGLLDVIVLKGENAFGLIPPFVATLLDRNGAYPDRGDMVDIYQGSHVRVTADPPLPLQFDGDPCKHITPFEARLLPLSSRFVVSEACLEHYAG